MKHTKCYIPEYPRPQFVRADWQNLCGEWDFGFGEETSEKNALDGKLSRKIIVPFSYQSKASGIGLEEHHALVWYSRKISGKPGKRTILNIDGADYETSVFVNGKLVGTHVGAYSRFSFDITDFLAGEDNILTIRCSDDNHPIQVRGKQRWEKQNFGCWYVETTGIYKSVWLEYVDDVYLTNLKITPSIKDYSVRFDFAVNKPSHDTEVKFAISYDGKPICSARVSADDVDNGVSLRLDSRELTYQVEHWSVGNPVLYDVDITVYNKDVPVDAVGSYFGLREYVTKDDKIMLNNVPFYARLVLDQGYWPESGLTPPSEEAIINDIILSKEMGFNGARKHQKVEDERYFYYADILGFTVWCELPSNHWASDKASKQITREWLDIVTQNYNHPSLVTWVIFNESWGVRNIMVNPEQSNLATGLYYLTKSIDSMRPVISNDGWMHAKSDILTLHHYEQDGEKLYSFYDDIYKLVEGDITGHQHLPYANGYEYEGQPIIMSEFGGTAYVGETNDVCWGYGNGVANDDEYIERLTSLVEAIKRMNISGYCYTQITDVEQEVNGVLRADRTPKVALEHIKKINS